MSRLVCIFHASDFDGHGSAAIVRYFNSINKLYTEEYYYPLSYKSDIPLHVINDITTVVMIDIGYKPEVMQSIYKKAGKFIWIDHHKSTINANETHYEGIRDYQSFKSAIYLTWEYFFKENKNIPKVVDLLSDYDLWNNKNKTKWESETLPFQYGLRSHDINARFKTPILFNMFEDDGYCDLIIEEGKHILRYIRSTHKKIIPSTLFIYNKDGLNYLCANSQGSSLVFEDFYNPKDHDVMLLYEYKGKYNEWCFTIYSHKNNIDASEIAKKYGDGGGHKDAAGFTLKTASQFFDNHPAFK